MIIDDLSDDRRVLHKLFPMHNLCLSGMALLWLRISSLFCYSSRPLRVSELLPLELCVTAAYFCEFNARTPTHGPFHLMYHLSVCWIPPVLKCNIWNLLLVFFLPGLKSTGKIWQYNTNKFVFLDFIHVLKM